MHDIGPNSFILFSSWAILLADFFSTGVVGATLCRKASPQIKELYRARSISRTCGRTRRPEHSPQPLNAEQVAGLVELLKNPPAGEEETLLDLITNRVPPGVDEAAYVKAGFLSAVAKGEAACPLIDRWPPSNCWAICTVATTSRRWSACSDDAELGAQAAEELKHTLLMFDAFHDVAELAKQWQRQRQAVMQSWADGEWFTNQDAVPESIKVAVFKVTGETNTDDLSPAPDAWSRPDIPLHALAMYKMTRDGLEPEEHGVTGPMKQIADTAGQGPARRLRRRRGRHRFIAQVCHQLRAVVLWRRHSRRTQQERRRHLHRRQGCPHFLQHHGRRRRTGI